MRNGEGRGASLILVALNPGCATLQLRRLPSGQEPAALCAAEPCSGDGRNHPWVRRGTLHFAAGPPTSGRQEHAEKPPGGGPEDGLVVFTPSSSEDRRTAEQTPSPTGSGGVRPAMRIGGPLRLLVRRRGPSARSVAVCRSTAPRETHSLPSSAPLLFSLGSRSRRTACL